MTAKTQDHSLSLLKNKPLGEESSASVHEINIETAQPKETKTTSLYDNPRGYYPLPTPPLGRRGARETFPVSQLRLPTH